jgi:lipopolysaccharide export system permease protein
VDFCKQHTLKLKDRPVVITPADAADWLKPDQCFVVSGITFDALIEGQKVRQFFSTAQLIAGLHNDCYGYGPDVRVAVHSRIVQPLLDITLLFLGMPLVISRENRNVFLAIGLCMGVVGCFLMVVIGMQQLGEQSVVRPATAAWVPLMLFVPLATRFAEGMWK